MKSGRYSHLILAACALAESTIIHDKLPRAHRDAYAAQDPRRGGLIIAHPGEGTYIDVAFTLHRQ